MNLIEVNNLLEKQKNMPKSKQPKIERLIFKSYLAMIKNSPGTNMFKNFFVLLANEEKDVTQNGSLACAFFVSSVLTIWGLVEHVSGTVTGVETMIKKSGWLKINRPKPGAVLVWEEKKEHRHIGFCLSPHLAVSNCPNRPKIHDLNFSCQNRKLEAIYWHPSFDK